MSSTGAVAWARHFKGKGPVFTVMKKDSIAYDQDGKNIGRVSANQPVVALESEEYLEKYPVKLPDGRVVYVTFNNIQKPKGKRVTGIKLKPQDFKLFQTKYTWKAKDLALALIDEIEERQDLDPVLKNYLTVLTKYYAKIDSVTASDVDQTYSNDIPGLAETQKDYGEMIGAIACTTHNILAPYGYTLTPNDSIEFPIRGNEPIIDYYIHRTGKPKLAISAKSGSITNTLKARDILTLLKSQKLDSKWANKPIYKFIEIVDNKPIVELPFHALNIIKPNLVTTKALDEVRSKFKQTTFQSTSYAHHLFSDVFKYLGFNVTKPPRIGELFYAAEKEVVKYMNSSNPADEIFKDATSGLVIYVKFEISASNRHGKLEVVSSDLSNMKKKVIWRSKNGTTRAADKLGLQT